MSFIHVAFQDCLGLAPGTLFAQSLHESFCILQGIEEEGIRNTYDCISPLPLSVRLFRNWSNNRGSRKTFNPSPPFLFFSDLSTVHLLDMQYTDSVFSLEHNGHERCKRILCWDENVIKFSMNVVSVPVFVVCWPWSNDILQKNTTPT